MSIRVAWIRTFELSDNGVPTGRWQWVCDSREGTFRYPNEWLDADAIAPPPFFSDDEALRTTVQQ